MSGRIGRAFSFLFACTVGNKDIAVNMDLRFLCLLIIMKFTGGHQTPTAAAHQQMLHYRPLHIYPAYQIVNAQPKTVIESKTEQPVGLDFITSSTATPVSEETEVNSENFTIDPNTSKISTDTALATLEVSTDNTIYTPAEFPHDLLEIARTKLGLKSLDEVPSISELAEYLGTANAEETIKYIRQLTSTEQGVALVKAYLESADFTDRTEEARRRQQPKQQLQAGTEVDLPTQFKSNILERIMAYFHIYNLWPQSNNGTNTNETRKAVEQQFIKYIKPQLAYKKHIQTATPANHTAPAHHAMNHHRPFLVRNPLPYHYPIPLRPIYDNRVVQPQPAVYSHVHLNTPKFHIPPHIQLARAVNIPPQQLQTLLQSKPKLAELAAKVNHLPLTNDHTGQINAQLLAAVKRAVEQDEDLRRLLQSTAATLK